ncbi:helix-turn-helix transcriptional regulator [Peribacillus sp. SCS-155]|uniref:helix-turn-helix transcriptional regulator n=1 Tax=Peribacillus sedimenti TaxID=3115297 RepID=UPI003905B0DA
MKKSNHQTVSLESVGISQREFLTMYLLHTLTEKPNYPTAIHQQLKSLFSGKVHSYDYLCKTANNLVESKHLELYTKKGRNYYKITEKGTELLTWYQENFRDKLSEVKLVIDRFVFGLTGTGDNPKVEHDLPEEYRSYFSKLVSVKDLVRYVTLKMGFDGKRFYMGEVGDLLKENFGWIASNGYLYDLAHEMEEKGLLVGRWEGEKRTKRFLKITEEGRYHYKQIADSAAYQVREIQKYINSVLSFLGEKVHLKN